MRALNLLANMHKLSSLALALSHARSNISGTHQLLQTHTTLIHHSLSGDTEAIPSSSLLKPSAAFPSSTLVRRKIRKTVLIKIHAL